MSFEMQRMRSKTSVSSEATQLKDNGVNVKGPLAPKRTFFVNMACVTILCVTAVLYSFSMTDFPDRLESFIDLSRGAAARDSSNIGTHSAVTSTSPAGRHILFIQQPLPLSSLIRWGSSGRGTDVSAANLHFFLLNCFILVHSALTQVSDDCWLRPLEGAADYVMPRADTTAIVASLACFSPPD